MPFHLSIIVPTLNEAPVLAESLERVQPMRRDGHQLVVADGGSTDDTVSLADGLADLVIPAPRGRARQMNAGAARATGDSLVFLHADTWLPADADRLISTALGRRGAAWGRFDVRLSGRHFPLRVVERLMNTRSRLTGIATGDQTFFMKREVFAAVGGFPDIPLMEDIAMSRRLRRIAAPVCLRNVVVVSSRRWEEQGIARTILLMWRLRLAFALGADPQTLARMYYSTRT